MLLDFIKLSPLFLNCHREIMEKFNYGSIQFYISLCACHAQDNIPVPVMDSFQQKRLWGTQMQVVGRHFMGLFHSKEWCKAVLPEYVQKPTFYIFSGVLALQFFQGDLVCKCYFISVLCIFKAIVMAHNRYLMSRFMISSSRELSLVSCYHFPGNLSCLPWHQCIPAISVSHGALSLFPS